MEFLKSAQIARNQDDLPNLSLEEDKNRKEIQREVFDGKILKELKGKLSKLDPYFDKKDGLIRVGGRLKQGTLPYAVKQVILPKDHHTVKLLVMYYHKKKPPC